MARRSAAALAWLAVAVLLTDCSGHPAQSVAAAAGTTASASPVPLVAATPPTPAPTPVASAPAPVASAPPPPTNPSPTAVAPAPRSIAPTVQTLSFPLQSVNQPLTGMVLVEPRAGSYTITVQVSGLAPGSVHSVHLHFGACPSSGVHLLVLGTLNAGAAGTASVVSRLPGSFVGDGRFVIVYVGPSAGPLGGCAQLSGRA